MLLFKIFFTGEERGVKRKPDPYSVVYEILSGCMGRLEKPVQSSSAAYPAKYKDRLNP